MFRKLILKHKIKKLKKKIDKVNREINAYLIMYALKLGARNYRAYAKTLRDSYYDL